MARALVSGDGMRSFAAVLDRYREAIEHPEPALERVMSDLEAAADAGFAAGRRPLGGKWAALSSNYAAYKRVVRPGAPILTFDGDLRASLGRARGAGAIRVVSGQRMRYGTSISYAAYHQKGTPGMPARPVLPSGGARLQVLISKALHEHIINSGR